MWISLGYAALFGGLGILLSTIGYLIFDVVDYRVNHGEELKKGNMAVAVVIASFIVGICYIIGRAIGS